MEVKIYGITGAIVYCAIGLLVYLLLYADPFSWTNPWVYVVTVLWPFALVYEFIWILIYIIIIIACIGFVVMLVEKIKSGY